MTDEIDKGFQEHGISVMGTRDMNKIIMAMKENVLYVWNEQPGRKWCHIPFLSWPEDSVALLAIKAGALLTWEERPGGSR